MLLPFWSRPSKGTIDSRHRTLIRRIFLMERSTSASRTHRRPFAMLTRQFKFCITASRCGKQSLTTSRLGATPIKLKTQKSQMQRVETMFLIQMLAKKICYMSFTNFSRRYRVTKSHVVPSIISDSWMQWSRLTHYSITMNIMTHMNSSTG